MTEIELELPHMIKIDALDQFRGRHYMHNWCAEHLAAGSWKRSSHYPNGLTLWPDSWTYKFAHVGDLMVFKIKFGI